MKRFLIIGVIAAAFSTHANACVAEYSDHNYYMFSVFNRDLTSPAYRQLLAEVCRQYILRQLIFLQMEQGGH